MLLPSNIELLCICGPLFTSTHLPLSRALLVRLLHSNIETMSNTFQLCMERNFAWRVVIVKMQEIVILWWHPHILRRVSLIKFSSCQWSWYSSCCTQAKILKQEICLLLMTFVMLVSNFDVLSIQPLSITACAGEGFNVVTLLRVFNIQKQKYFPFQPCWTSMLMNIARQIANKQMVGIAETSKVFNLVISWHETDCHEVIIIQIIYDFAYTSQFLYSCYAEQFPAARDGKVFM